MRGVNMTKGNILRQLVVFAWPILLGMVFQQLYVTIDAIIVGNYVSRQALAAVGGSAGSLINMIISFAVGLFAGANVLISRFFGAGDAKGVHDAVHTELTLAVVLGLALSVVGVLFTPHMLRMIGAPDEIMPDATEYLRIYMTGLPILMVYNAGASIITAMGDSGRPLIFLIVASILHVILALLFIIVLGWGVAGVAWSTVLSMSVSVVLVIIALCRTDGSHRLHIKHLRIHFNLLGKIMAIGLPGGLQGTIVSFSNVVVQAYINGLGAIVIAGYSSSTRIDAFSQMPMLAMAAAIATFVGQNLGAGQVTRARKGVRYSMIISIAVTVVLSALTLTFSRTLLGLFTSDMEVIAAGRRFMSTLAPTYFILTGAQVLPGALRGAGDVRFTSITSVVCFVFIRQLYLYIISNTYYSINTVALCYPITWSIAFVALAIYYLRSDWSGFENKTEGELT